MSLKILDASQPCIYAELQLQLKALVEIFWRRVAFPRAFVPHAAFKFPLGLTPEVWFSSFCYTKLPTFSYYASPSSLCKANARFVLYRLRKKRKGEGGVYRRHTGAKQRAIPNIDSTDHLRIKRQRNPALSTQISRVQRFVSAEDARMTKAAARHMDELQATDCTTKYGALLSRSTAERTKKAR